jgi:hypothetical protein
MRAFVIVAAAVVLALCGGCATQTVPTAVVTSAATKAVAAERAKHAVVPGKSSKTDVLAALGESLVIRFDSGYEVWVYRLDGGPDRSGRVASFLRPDAQRAAAAEFVILFAPSGLVSKTRIRPAPQSRRES